jgi:hypothetical protein
VCQNRRCQRTVSVDAPEALAVGAILELATMPIRVAA